MGEHAIILDGLTVTNRKSQRETRGSHNVKLTAAVLSGLLLSSGAPSFAETNAPPGLGQAGAWVLPCALLDKQIRVGKVAEGAEGIQATLCLGVFTGIMAVNYISPPYLPFCIGDNDSTIDFVRIFLAFMAAHPEYRTKNFGLTVMVALGQVHPKKECS